MIDKTQPYMYNFILLYNFYNSELFNGTYIKNYLMKHIYKKINMS